MKKYFLLTISFSLLLYYAQAQLEDVLKRKAAEGVKNGAEVSTEKAIDKTVDKALDKLFNGKKKKDKPEPAKPAATVAKPDKPATTDQTSPNAGSIKTYSKYDFIPGDKVLGYDDFMNDAVGDFPGLWNTNASGEIMTVDRFPGHWLNVSKEGMYLPKYIKNLPDNFTFEYDLLFLPPQKSAGPNTAIFSTQIINQTDPRKFFEYQVDRAYFDMDPYMGNINIASYTKSGDKLLENQFSVAGVQRQKMFTYHVSVWRQKTRLRVYLNETKVVDAPSLLAEGTKYNTIRFNTSLNNDGSTWLISNVKFASGLPDTRNKLMTVGKFSTTGILFASNSSIIQPLSYGTLKEIATVLKENPILKIRIIGYTDSDGEDAVNLDLSKKRAEAVKTMLVKEFGIEAERMESDGKGETQPVAPNTTTEGKAQNRRVDFIKL